MMFVRAMFIVNLVMAILGTTMGDKEQVNIESTTEFVFTARHCEMFSSIPYYIVVSEANKCAELGGTSETLHQLRNARDIEDFQEFFRGYCQRQSVVRECLAAKSNKFEFCVNATFVDTMNFYRGILESILDVECSKDGGQLAALWHGMQVMKSNYSVYDAATTPCFKNVSVVVKEIVDSSTDISSKVYIAYREAHVFKECIQVEMEPSFKQVVDSFLSGVINRMKCQNPQDGSQVLCNTLDDGLNDTLSVCDLKTNNNKIPIYDSLENQAFRCFDFMRPDFKGSDIRDTVVSTCRARYVDEECLAKIHPFTIQCMNETQQHEFTIFLETVKQSFYGACAEGGIPFSEILYQVEALHNETRENGNAVLECMETVQVTRKQLDIIPTSKNLRYFKELETFKECLAGKIHGNQINVDAVSRLYNEIRKVAKCVHPEDGTTVLCETLVTNE